MNWFERHLNWTAIFIAIGSLVLCSILVIISTGGYNTLLRVSYLQGFFIYLLLLIVAGCLILSAIGYRWVLHKKNRSLAFLFFFAPVFIFIIVSFIYHFPFTTGIPVLFSTFFQLILVTGWIVLFLLKNHSPAQYTEEIMYETKLMEGDTHLGLISFIKLKR